MADERKGNCGSWCEKWCIFPLSISPRYRPEVKLADNLKSWFYVHNTRAPYGTTWEQCEFPRSLTRFMPNSRSCASSEGRISASPRVQCPQTPLIADGSQSGVTASTPCWWQMIRLYGGDHQPRQTPARIKSVTLSFLNMPWSPSGADDWYGPSGNSPCKVIPIVLRAAVQIYERDELCGEERSWTLLTSLAQWWLIPELLVYDRASKLLSPQQKEVDQSERVPQVQVE